MEVGRSVGELARRARDGERDAWEALVREFSPMVWNVARSYRLNDADAADAHAGTWVRLIDNIDRIREPDRIAGWLSRTAANESLAIIRKNSRAIVVAPDRFELSAAPESVDIDESIVAAEDISTMRRALRRLGDPCQQLLRLLYAEPKLSYEQIADVTGRPVGSIGPTRRRCLEKVRADLQSTDLEST